MVLWSAAPATSWQQEAYPVGNGKLAAMVFGGVATEQIQFNEDTIWNGQPHDYSNPNATPAHLASIQATVFNRQDIWSEAQTNFMSQPLRQPAYQPAGVLSLTFPHSSTANYRRSLDLNTATASVRYDFNGVTYSRDVFASAPSNRVIVVRLTASQTASINFSCSFSTLQTDYSIRTVGSDLVLHAKVTAKPRAEYYAAGLTNAIEYEARARVLAEGGSVTAGTNSLSVANADAVTLLLSVASNFKSFNDVSANPAVICSSNIVAAAANTYSQLRQAQLNDYQPLFRRVVLDLGSTGKTNYPTGYRVKRAFEGDDPQLSALYFQMGRYLMIAGSRPGAQPLTLQGKWNDVIAPSWDSKMTLNINQELNYSGAEIANLSECHEPMFDLIADLAVTGGKVAQAHYNAGGWVVHHNTDLWRAAAPINNRDGIWPTGGAWLCQNLWWHFEFSGDTNWLATTAYPLMKSAAQFFADFLIPHPAQPNWLVTNPSYSPEHNWKQGAVEVANVAGPTMDNDLLRELFNNVIQASQALGVDAAFRTNVMALRDRLPPDQVGKYGQLQEWLEDVDAPGDTHRHCSHLVGLYPGEVITPFYNPRICAAAKVSTDSRSTGDIGWGKAWRIGLQARLLNAPAAYLIHTNMLSRDVSTNLMFTDVNNRQCDGIFGSLGSVAEMFLQSHAGELLLLPALPPKWTNGLISGLCARGGFEVSIQWQSNRLASASILSRLGNRCRVRSKWPIRVQLGSNFVDAPMILPGLREFPTVVGNSYTILPAYVRETEQLPATATAGAAHGLVTNAMFSEARGTKLSANAAGDSVTYTVPNVTAGTYRVRVVADAGADRSRFQLACGPGGGTLTNLGSMQDTYSATNCITLYSTNLLTELDCGSWTAPADGPYQFRFTITDRNPASAGNGLVLDFIELLPLPAPPPLSPIEQWRGAKFGANADNPAIAGNAADPDGDGLSNAAEYALGREPWIRDATNLFSASVVPGFLTLTYQRAKAATDVTFMVEANGEPGPGWTTNVSLPSVLDDGNGLTETVRVQDAVPVSNARQRFLRFSVVR